MNEDAPPTPPGPGPEPAAPAEAPALGAKRALQILAAFLGTQLAVGGVVGLYGRWGAAVDSKVALGAAVVGTLLAGLVVLGMVRRTFARPGGDDARASIGWIVASPRASVRAALQGLALALAQFFGSALLMGSPRLVGPFARVTQEGGFTRAVWAVLVIVIGPPLEELIFRGVLYAGLARRWRPRVAGAVTTALFVAVHVPELGAFPPAWLIIAVVSTLALRARVATGSLVPAIALHAAYNLGVLVMAFAW